MDGRERDVPGKQPKAVAGENQGTWAVFSGQHTLEY